MRYLFFFATAILGILTGIASDSALAADAARAGLRRGKLIIGGGPSESARRLGATFVGESALASALAWLDRHQLPDGSWCFDLRAGRCQGRCTYYGSLNDGRSAATGLALLPLMFAKNTHEQGKYKNNVRAGLWWVIDQMGPDGAMNTHGDDMYSQGITALALSEAFVLAKDHGRTIIRPAQAAINFIEDAQDSAGGWRYQPHLPLDTSVTSWQVSALHVGRTSGLKVSDETWKGVDSFLNSVQSEGGAKYGYASAGARPDTTAMGLLCSIYLGTKRDDPALVRGVQYLSKIGPSKDNLNYNYYATQVLFHYGGDEWKKWNDDLRELLINSQAQDGHEKGSWFFPRDPGASAGGRHYCTCMAAMILGVYYRQPRIYDDE